MVEVAVFLHLKALLVIEFGYKLQIQLAICVASVVYFVIKNVFVSYFN